jgi:hypothetical protein
VLFHGGWALFALVTYPIEIAARRERQSLIATVYRRSEYLPPGSQCRLPSGSDWIPQHDSDPSYRYVTRIGAHKIEVANRASTSVVTGRRAGQAATSRGGKTLLVGLGSRLEGSWARIAVGTRFRAGGRVTRKINDEGVAGKPFRYVYVGYYFGKSR